VKLVLDRQPASHRPAFTRDGERLVLVEGADLVVRERRDDAWPVARRVPLGRAPTISATSRPVVLSPDEREAVLCDHGQAWRVPLAGGDEARVEALETADVVSALYVGDELAVARWGEGVAETRLFAPGASTPLEAETLPFALLEASPEGRTWLVNRSPRKAAGAGFTLRLVDAATREDVGVVPFEGRADGGWAHLTMAAFTRDGKRLGVVDSLRLGLVIDARTGTLVQRIREYEGDRMIGLAFSADGRSMVTGGRRHDPSGEAVLLWVSGPDRTRVR
jgi:hypothetical protein